jgi:hemoglobin
MKKDIENIADLEKLFYRFYEVTRGDDLLDPIFQRIKGERFEEHVHTISSFFDNVLFFTGSYEGNPMEKHHMINLVSRFQPAQFERWLKYFCQVTDELYAGEHAKMLKKRVVAIGKVMEQGVIDPPTNTKVS